MLKWQRAARWLIAITAAVFAVIVVSTLGRRNQNVTQAPLPGTDPKATAESGTGLTFRVNGNKEEIRIEYQTQLTYEDGSTKMLGVKATTERNGGKTFTMTGKEGKIADKESKIELSGGVHVIASDGFELWTDQASYNQADSTTHADGKVEFARGRMKGSGVGFIYDKNHNILNVFDQAVVDVVADEAGAGAMHVTSGTMEFRRDEKILRFDRSMQATRGGHLLAAETAVAHLSDDEQRLQALELRAQSSITAEKPASGALRSMTGRDMDLKYAADGEALEHAVVKGNGFIQIEGDTASTGREIVAQSIDLTLAPDGTTLTHLTANENVRLTLPPTRDTPGRIITSAHLESQGDEKGLSRAVFSGTVEFSERSASASRTAHSGTLSAVVGSGFSSVDEARFTQRVRFVDGEMTATAAVARYVVKGGTLELSGTEPESPAPHVVNGQIRLDATRMDVTLEGPDIKATGAVKSLLLPQGDKKRSDGKPPDKMPSMLKQDKPVNVTAAALDYRGGTSRATYTGGVLLWQGDTSIKAPTLSIDSEKGDLSAEGNVTTVVQLVQDKDGKRESSRSTATSKTFNYEDAKHRATYTGEAHVTGQAGDLTAPKVEMYMKESGDELDRLEAYEGLKLRVDKKKTDGVRLTYFSEDERYVVRGTPVTLSDDCGRETTGASLTFWKSADRIVVDGNAQNPTQTKGKSNCPGT